VKIFVTGAAGFIGSHLVRKLVNDGHTVYVLVRPGSNLWRLKDIQTRIQVLTGEIAEFDLENVKSFLKGTEMIFHLAAAGVNQAHAEARGIVNTNIMGTLQVLQLASCLQVRQFLYCGSCFEYGSGSMLTETGMPAPNSEYSASKTGGWLIVNAFHARYGLPVVSVRPFTVYGPFEAHYRLVPHVILQSMRNAEIGLTVGGQTRDFIFIDDVIEGLLAVMERTGLEGETFNLSTGKETSIKDMAALIAHYFGCEDLLKFGALSYRQNEIWNLSGDTTYAKDKLGWEAKTGLEKGVEKTIVWFEQNHLKFGEYKS
jgi:nucleoside-diphosphate-sugar epimerase